MFVPVVHREGGRMVRSCCCFEIFRACQSESHAAAAGKGRFLVKSVMDVFMKENTVAYAVEEDGGSLWLYGGRFMEFLKHDELMVS